MIRTISISFFNRGFAFETNILISDISRVEIQLITNKSTIFIHHLNIDSMPSGIIRFSDELLMINIFRALQLHSVLISII